MRAPHTSRRAGPGPAAFVARAAGVALLAFALTGCAMFDKKAPPPCPRVVILKDASKLTRFAPGPGRDLTDVLFEAAISGFGPVSGCDYADVNSDTGEGPLEVNADVMVELARGPADVKRKADFSYFVRITDKDGNILTGKSFKAEVDFPGNRNRLIWTDDPFYMYIPLKKGQTGRDYQIFVGFDLSHEELQYNRKQAGESGR